tara:strand:+ start:64 stop:840 length:777 start_codon:yes stop_codon:yes gene_type:complete
METKTKRNPEIGEDNWELKDRNYFLSNDLSPLTYTLSSKHSRRFPLLYFDEKSGKQRELRYATNQNSCFVDEQQGMATLEHVVFRNGVLFVPKEKQSLQKLLSLYHPLRFKKYQELDNKAIATDEIETIEAEFAALSAARELDIEHSEAILRVEVGSRVSEMSSKEIKRDLLIFAKRNPLLFIELVNDENVELRNFAIKATEAQIIKLSQDQRTFSWASNGKKLMQVPFDEHPYSAFAVYLKTDEGIEIYKSIDKKMK